MLKVNKKGQQFNPKRERTAGHFIGKLVEWSIAPVSHSGNGGEAPFASSNLALPAQLENKLRQ